MSDAAEVLEATLDLLSVAGREWISSSARVSEEARTLTVERAERRACLARIRAGKARLHEIDAQVELLWATPSLPNVQEHIAALRELRARVAEEC